MTQSSTRFISYRPCQSNKKIALADGTFITTVGKGDIMINQNLILKDVLHVPKLCQFDFCSQAYNRFTLFGIF